MILSYMKIFLYKLGTLFNLSLRISTIDTDQKVKQK